MLSNKISMFRSSKSQVFQVVLIATALVAISFVLRLSGMTVVETQRMLFPFVLIFGAIVAFATSRAFASFLALAASFFVLAEGFSRGLLVSRPATVAFSKLPEAEQNSRLESAQKRYAEIAKVYDLPRARSTLEGDVMGKFAITRTADIARPISALVTNLEGREVIVPNWGAVISFVDSYRLALVASSEKKIISRLEREVSSPNTSLPVFNFKLWSSEATFKLRLAPRQMAFPLGVSQENNLHFLGWYSEALAPRRLYNRFLVGPEETHEELEKVIQAARDANAQGGPWGKTSLRAAVQYLTAFYRLLEFSGYQGQLPEALLQRISKDLAYASKNLRGDIDPSLMADIINLAAIIRVENAKDLEELKKCRKWFKQALKLAGKSNDLQLLQILQDNLSTFDALLARVAIGAGPTANPGR